MTKPLFSLSYSLDQNTQTIFPLWLKASFWQRIWSTKCQSFYLPAISTKVQGWIKLQPLLPQYSITLTNVQPEKSLEFVFSSPYHSLCLSYCLTGDNPTILNITVSKSGSESGINHLFDWLAKPYLYQHVEKVATVCREIENQENTVVIEGEIKTKNIEQIFPTSGFFLWHLANAWQKKLDQALKEFNLTSTQWLLLFNLLKSSEAKQAVTVSSLAQQLNLNPVHVSDVISSLVDKHFVHKVKLPNDNRKFQLTATPDGKIAAAQTNIMVIQAERKFFYSLSITQKQQLANTISKLATPPDSNL